MSKFIKLHAIDLKIEKDAIQNGASVTYSVVESVAPSNARFSGLEYDDLELPRPSSVPAFPTNIAVDHIREYHFRKNGQAGTRIVFVNSAATVVKESLAEVQALLDAMNN